MPLGAKVTPCGPIALASKIEVGKESINVPSVLILYIIFILASQTQSVLSGA